jgi:hypothetical protein
MHFLDSALNIRSNTMPRSDTDILQSSKPALEFFLDARHTQCNVRARAVCLHVRDVQIKRCAERDQVYARIRKVSKGARQHTSHHPARTQTPKSFDSFEHHLNE